jgi:hypothetical protein
MKNSRRLLAGVLIMASASTGALAVGGAIAAERSAPGCPPISPAISPSISPAISRPACPASDCLFTPPGPPPGARPGRPDCVPPGPPDNVPPGR